MLTALRIRNLALVEELDWTPGRGFISLTGETGAGKSILIGALKLLVGERADKSVIRSGAESCAVEATFDEAPGIGAILDESGVDPCEGGELLLRRTLSASGPARQFVNGCACPLSLLRRLGEQLVDLHGPHDHQSLFAREEQTRLLDDFASATNLRGEMALRRKTWLDLRRERDELAADDQLLRRELETLTHQVREIADANLDADEEEPLLARHKAASNSQRLAEVCAEIGMRLAEGEANVLSQLTESARLLRELHRLDDRTQSIFDEHALAVEKLESVVAAVADVAGSLESDPEQIRTMEERLDRLQVLKRKYGSTLADVIAFGTAAGERLRRIETRDERLTTLEGEIAAAGVALAGAAADLGKARRKAAPKLAKKVGDQLRDLGFLQAGFEIQFEMLCEPGAWGSELAEFLFAPNPGEPAAPLRSIASSGEISRVMLALKTALAAQDRIPLLVFDEIDANVGGEVARRVGLKMREIGESHQVVCITHLPQVAASAREHFVVSKVVRGGRTFSELHPVERNEREEEIARMLGGKTESILRHARELLERKEPGAPGPV